MKPHKNKVFASNKAAIAILKSLYSNEGVTLKYPYLINKESPLVLHIHKPKEGTLMRAEKGFVYVVDPEGFKEEPADSWQFVTESETKIRAVVEIEGDDFTYPVKIFTDSDSKE